MSMPQINAELLAYLSRMGFAKPAKANHPAKYVFKGPDGRLYVLIGKRGTLRNTNRLRGINHR